MATDELIEMKYPISIEWIFEDEFFGHCMGEERFKTYEYKLPGFPVTYFLTLNYEQIDDSYPDISVKLNCFCDYRDVEIEANFKIALKIFHRKRSGKENVKEMKFIFNNEKSEVECFVEEGWRSWDDPGVFIFELSGTFTIKNLPSLPLSIELPQINQQQMFEDDNGKDFTIISEGQELKVHKFILQQISTVLSQMFELNWKETNERKIEFPNMSFKLTKIAIELFYGKKYLKFLDKNEYLQLFQFAEQWDIFALKNAVKNSIILTPQNIIEYINLVVEFKCDELIQHCIDYLFICTQYSLPIKDITFIKNDAKILFAERMLISPILKKNIKDENKTRVSIHAKL